MIQLHRANIHKMNSTFLVSLVRGGTGQIPLVIKQNETINAKIKRSLCLYRIYFTQSHIHVMCVPHMHVVSISFPSLHKKYPKQ